MFVFMKQYLSRNLLDTKKLAIEVANKLKGGEVIGLIGELGAGKTTLVQFLAKALRVKEKVLSPTFVLMKIYKISNNKKQITNFIHVDAYRLNNGDELKSIGLEEYLGRKDSVVVIEWADKVKEILPKGAMIITFKESDNERQRIIEF